MKILITILFFFISVVCFSQSNIQYLGSPSTLVVNRGYFRSDSGAVVSYNFPDTTTANKGIIKTIPNIVINVNDSLWKRSNDATVWKRIGSGSGISIGNSSSLVSTVTQGYSEVAQGNSNYDAFGIPVVHGDTIWVFFKSSPNHGGEGKLLVTRTINQNYSYDSTWQVTVTGNPDSCTNLSAGMTSTGRMVIGWKSSRGGNFYNIAYSDNGALNWTAASGYSFTGTGFPFGRIQPIDGRIIAPFYTTGTADSSFLISSTDNGVTWSFYSTVAASSTDTYTETDIAYVGIDSLIAIVRNDAISRCVQFKSTNNGVTWTRVGGLNILQFSTNNSPIFIQWYNGNLWLLGGYRDPVGDNSVFWYSKGFIKNVFSDTSQWSKRAAIYHPISDDAGSFNDMGYTFPLVFQSILMMCGYDVSPLQITTATRITRIFTIPVIGNGNFVKAYNNSNQSISNNIATLVTFPQVDMNDGLLYNTDSSFFISIRDGWYQIKVTVTYDTSAAGSYRQLYLYLTSAAFNSGGTVKQPQIISKTTIAGHQSNFDFDRMECNVIYFVRKGEKIQVFTKQDSGGSLNLINNTVDRMATLNAKRIE